MITWDRLKKKNKRYKERGLIAMKCWKYTFYNQTLMNELNFSIR